MIVATSVDFFTNTIYTLSRIFLALSVTDNAAIEPPLAHLRAKMIF